VASYLLIILCHGTAHCIFVPVVDESCFHLLHNYQKEETTAMVFTTRAREEQEPVSLEEIHNAMDAEV
jgi:glutathione peroxidase-family protein